MIAQFGRFRLDSQRRELLADGVAVPIGGRAFDVLVALIEARGELVTKDQLLNRVWAGQIVEENNLQFQISTIRKALGNDRDVIKTIAGRGYQFLAEAIAPVGRNSASSGSGAAAAPPVVASAPSTNLPVPASDLIGREAQLAQLAELVATHRLVTLVGAGGIGKTRLGLELGRRMLPRFADGVWIAELAPLSDPEHVLSTVAAALGLTGGPATPKHLAASVASRRLLLVLDNCEHLIDAAARIADAFLHASATLQVVATSREQLDVEGEVVYRVPALDVPAEADDDAEDALRHSAVRLLAARARMVAPRLSLDAQFGAFAGKICRRLDGIPLAIELAAARVAALGIDDLAARIDDRFSLLTGGHRTALARHQTLRATLDWSHDALPEQERLVFRRLSIFSGSFALNAASTVAADDDMTAAQVVACIANLVVKSLLVADVGADAAQYRLLETTRAYALEKLTESGELGSVARRHAGYFRQLLAEAESDWERLPAAEWAPAWSRQVGNLRAALDWAFSSEGDLEIGVDLLVPSVPLWIQLSLMEECRERVEGALAKLGPDASRPTRRNMQLYAALGFSLMPNPAALAKALELADALEDNTYRLRALWGLWINRLATVALDDALALARRFAGNARQPIDGAIGDRMVGFSLHFLGDHVGARDRIESMLGRRAVAAHGSRTVRFQFDLWVTARAQLAEVLWILGLPDQAMRAAEIAVADARAVDHVNTLCNTLWKACPVAAFCGDWGALETFSAMLLAHAAKHDLASWQAQVRCYTGLLLTERGDSAGGLQAWRAALEDHPATLSAMRSNHLRGALAEALGRAGEIAEGRAMIDDVLARAEANQEGWCLPELLRIKGELLRMDGVPAEGEECLMRAMRLAQRHNALSWELRAATSLARLWNVQGRAGEARDLLSAVYSRFSEGFETADLRAARAMLDSLQ